MKRLSFELDNKVTGSRFLSLLGFVYSLYEKKPFIFYPLVGEMSSTAVPHCVQYTRPDRYELNMIFQFHHLKVDYPDGNKWSLGRMDFPALKQILSIWQTEMQKGGGWNTLFWCNHDQPRIVSRYGDDGHYRKGSAKMLALRCI